MAKRKWTNEEIAEYRKTHDGFYFNKEDGRIFVPKAYGIGLTMNWANPLTYVALVVLIAALVCVKFLFRY